MRVAILLARDLRGTDLVHQALRPVRDLGRLIVGGPNEPDQLRDVRVQLVGERLQLCGRRVVDPQHLLEPMEAGPRRCRHIAGARIDLGIEIAERLGDRLDPLVRLAGRREELPRLGDVPGANRVGESPRPLVEEHRLRDHVRAVRGNGLLRRGSIAARDRVAGHGQRSALVRRAVRAVELVLTGLHRQARTFPRARRPGSRPRREFACP